MEIESSIRKMKEINFALIEFIDDTENNDFESLSDILDYIENKEEVILILQLLSKIEDNHHRPLNFMEKMGKIIPYLINKIRPEITDFEIYQIFTSNKRIILLLLEQEIIRPDEKILTSISLSKDKNKFDYSHYLYSGIKSFIRKDESKAIEAEIKEKYYVEIDDFIEKVQVGENDSYICSLIRQDSVEDFITYVNRNNIKLSSQIIPSIYETHTYLMQKVTLIEYASFFGSIQIVRFLRYNGVRMYDSLWNYVIHSNNPDLVHFMEENNPFQGNIIQLYHESIKCHHNDIANYLRNNYYNLFQLTEYLISDIISSCNFYYYPSDIDSIISKKKSDDRFSISQVCFSLTTITIPSTVTSIGYNAFNGCSSIVQIIIPSSVTSIESRAFTNCPSLKQISIPSSVKIFGNSIFDDIKSIEIAGSIECLPNKLFEGCSLLEHASIPSSVKIIGNYVFSGCYSMKQITIPSSVTSIGPYAFYSCSSLTQITIPSSVTLIGTSAFERCFSLIQITIPSSVASIGDYAFYRCSSLTQITIPSSLTSIGVNTFSECSSLTQITIPSSVTSIGIYAFDRCSSLTQITISSSVTSIGDYAFAGCSSLTQITIPSSVTSIGDWAFRECSSLTQITIPSSINIKNLVIPSKAIVTLI